MDSQREGGLPRGRRNGEADTVPVPQPPSDIKRHLQSPGRETRRQRRRPGRRRLCPHPRGPLQRPAHADPDRQPTQVCAQVAACAHVTQVAWLHCVLAQVAWLHAVKQVWQVAAQVLQVFPWLFV